MKPEEIKDEIVALLCLVRDDNGEAGMRVAAQDLQDTVRGRITDIMSKSQDLSVPLGEREILLKDALRRVRVMFHQLSRDNTISHDRENNTYAVSDRAYLWWIRDGRKAYLNKNFQEAGNHQEQEQQNENAENNQADAWEPLADEWEPLPVERETAEPVADACGEVADALDKENGFKDRFKDKADRIIGGIRSFATDLRETLKAMPARVNHVLTLMMFLETVFDGTTRLGGFITSALQILKKFLELLLSA